MKPLAGALVILPFLTSCLSKYNVDSMERATRPIDGRGAFHVMRPEDGSFEGKPHRESGRMALAEIRRALLQSGAEATVAPTPESLDEALTAARAEKSTYVLTPKILHWEERATEWSGRPDRITMSYSLYDVATGQKLASSTISASSKWATFGGDHPEDLVPETVRTFINQGIESEMR